MMIVNKLRKAVVGSLAILSLIALSPVAAHAEWKKDNTGWWYSTTYGKGYLKDTWFSDNGNKYYFDSNGYMATGWKQMSSGLWYYFNNDGSMARETYIGNNYVNYGGVWDKEHDKVATTSNSGLTKNTVVLNALSVDIPTNYLAKTYDGYTSYIVDEAGTNIIFMNESMHGLTKDDFLKTSISDMKLQHDLQDSDIQCSKQIVASQTADIIDIQFEKDGKIVHSREVVLYHNGDVYFFALTGEVTKENIAKLNTILETVRFS